MYSLRLLLCGLVLLGAMSAQIAARAATPDSGDLLATGQSHKLWVTAYYPFWQQEHLPPSEIDFRAITHLVHFAIEPNADGTLGLDVNGMTATKSAAIIAATHAAGKQVLITVGGADTGARFRGAIADQNRATFVHNLIKFITTRGYDGLDIDMEPVEDTDAPHFQAFIRELRLALRAANPRYLLTAAVGGNPKNYLPIQRQFDQINIMTYDLSGHWEGWETWHNSPLYNGGLKFKSTGGPLPSCDGLATIWGGAGIARSKLGIGIPFYGYAWPGATGPNQDLTNVKTPYSLSYDDIMAKYYGSDRYHWHPRVEAPYLSIHSATAPENLFISYDDERLCAEKIKYAQHQVLGGVIIWELGSGYRPTLPSGQRNPLLDAIRRALGDK